MTQRHDEILAKMFRDKLLPSWMMNWLKTSDASYFDVFNQVEERLWFYYFLRIKKWIAWTVFGLSVSIYFGHIVWRGPEGQIYPSFIVIALIFMVSSLVVGIKIHQSKPPPAKAWDELTADLSLFLETVHGPEWIVLLYDLQPEVFDLEILEGEVDQTLLGLAENVLAPQTPLNGPEAVIFLQMRELADKFSLVTQG